MILYKAPRSESDREACFRIAGRRRRLVKTSFEEDIFTMKSLILAQDER